MTAQALLRDQFPAAPQTVVQALAAVMADVTSIGKDRVNEQQRFKFRGIDDVMNALHAPLARHGVLVMPQVQERVTETRETKGGSVMNVVHLRMRFTFYGPDGSSIHAETWGEAQDSADKATNKAMSAAYKYALLEVLCIPTEDQEDADKTTEAAAPRRQQAAPPVTQSAPGASHHLPARTATPADGEPAGAPVDRELLAAKRRVTATGKALGMSIQQLAEHYRASCGSELSAATVPELDLYDGVLKAEAGAPVPA